MMSGLLMLMAILGQAIAVPLFPSEDVQPSHNINRFSTPNFAPSHKIGHLAPFSSFDPSKYEHEETIPEEFGDFNAPSFHGQARSDPAGCIPSTVSKTEVLTSHVLVQKPQPVFVTESSVKRVTTTKFIVTTIKPELTAVYQSVVQSPVVEVVPRYITTLGQQKTVTITTRSTVPSVVRHTVTTTHVETVAEIRDHTTILTTDVTATSVLTRDFLITVTSFTQIHGDVSTASLPVTSTIVQTRAAQPRTQYTSVTQYTTMHATEVSFPKQTTILKNIVATVPVLTTVTTTINSPVVVTTHKNVVGVSTVTHTVNVQTPVFRKVLNTNTIYETKIVTSTNYLYTTEAVFSTAHATVVVVITDTVTTTNFAKIEVTETITGGVSTYIHPETAISTISAYVVETSTVGRPEVVTVTQSANNCK